MTTIADDESRSLNSSNQSSNPIRKTDYLTSSPVPPADFQLPSPDDIEELLLDCRYGDLDCVRSFVEKYGAEILENARDDRGNTVLHMCVANGHAEILAYLLSLPHPPVSLFVSTNDAGNTPLHWACLNGHLECVKLLVTFKAGRNVAGTSPVLGPALISVRNSAGQTPLGEAERAGWEAGAQWLVGVMDLQPVSETSVDGEEIGSEDAQGTTGTESPETQTRMKDQERIEIKLAQVNISEDSFGR